MAETLLITTDELNAQSAKLRTLSDQIGRVGDQANQAIGLLNDALSGKFSANMRFKGRAMLAQLQVLRDTLQTGANVAKKCAESFQNTDKVLREVIGDSLSDEVLDVPASTQEVLTPFDAKLRELQNTDGFRQGDSWGNTGTYVNYYKDQFIGGAQCFAMAHMMQVEVTGKRGYSIGSTSFADIQVGDAVNYYAPGTSETYGHWVFVIGKTDTSIIVAEGNYGEKVNWYREIPKDSMEIWQIDRAG